MTEAPRKSFKFCCKRTLSNQIEAFIASAKKTDKTSIYCAGECTNTFRLGEFTPNDGGSFFFGYNGWWYWFSLKTSNIEPFFPILIFNNDPETFALALKKEGLISDIGIKLLFGQMTQQEYVMEAMTVKNFDRNKMLEDFSMIIKCNTWWSCLIEKPKRISHYKEMAVNLINGTV